MLLSLINIAWLDVSIALEKISLVSSVFIDCILVYGVENESINAAVQLY